MSQRQLPTTLADLKRLAWRVLQIPADVPLHSVEVYWALQPVRAALGKVLTEIRENCSDETFEELERLCRLKNSTAKRKYAGTGSPDTSEETWEQMRAASLAGESLRSLAARFGVLYTAALSRRSEDERGKWDPIRREWFDRLPWRVPPPPSNVIQFPRSG